MSESSGWEIFPAVFPFRSRSPNRPFTGAISTVAKSTGAFSRGEVLTLCAWEQVQALCSKPGLGTEPRARLLHRLLISSWISFAEPELKRQPHQQPLPLQRHAVYAGDRSLPAKLQPAQPFCCPLSCRHRRSGTGSRYILFLAGVSFG